MNELDAQKSYWDMVAVQKTFTHPLNMKLFQCLVPRGAKILDYGCGYGRICAELQAHGYLDVTGVDISDGMITRGRSLFPKLDLRVKQGDILSFPEETFDVCIMFAVLTCIVTDSGHDRVISEMSRVLRRGGILYVSDYPLQTDERNQMRYREFLETYGTFGVFRLPDGGIVRHCDMKTIHHLLAQFALVDESFLEVSTMNGNAATVFQIIARRR